MVNYCGINSIFTILTFILVIIVLICMVKNKSKSESFRSHYYAPGEIIHPDVPETIMINGEEYDNPAWVALNSQWVKTDRTYEDYPIWKLR